MYGSLRYAETLLSDLLGNLLMTYQTDQIKHYRNVTTDQSNTIDASDDDGDEYVDFGSYGDEYEWETERRDA